MRKGVKSLAATGAALAVLALSAAPAAAEHSEWSALDVIAPPQTDQSTDDYFTTQQIAVADLDPTGLPIDTRLVTRVASRGGPQRTELIPSSTTNVQFLNQRGQPDIGTNGINVEVGGQEPSVYLWRALFDQPMPIALHVEYKLNGEVVDPTAVLGQSGELDVKYLITNADVKQKTLTYTNSAGEQKSEKQPVFPPFVGTLVSTLPEDFELIDTGTAVASTDDEGQTLLTWNILVYPPLGTNQQELHFKASVSAGEIPGLLFTMLPVPVTSDPAPDFSDQLLSNTVKGNESLTEGLDQINEQTLTLANATAELSAGLLTLADKTNEASVAYSTQLLPGAEQLAAGSQGIAAGQAELTRFLALSVTGAEQVETGAKALSDGLDGLVAGLEVLGTSTPKIQQGTAKILAATELLAQGVGDPDDGPIVSPSPTPSSGQYNLVQATKTAVVGMNLLSVALNDLVTGLEPLPGQLQAAAADARSAASDAQDAHDLLDPVLASLCNPPVAPVTQQQCDSMADSADAAALSAQEAGTVATDVDATGSDLAAQVSRARIAAAGADDLRQLLILIQEGVVEVAAALSGTSQQPGLVEALDDLNTAMLGLVQLAEQLEAGGKKLQPGAAALASGTAKLTDGLSQTESGSAQLATGSAELASGAALNVVGSEAFAQGIALLAAGMDESASGAEQLAYGADQLQSEGTQQILDQVIAGSDEPALASEWIRATDKRAKKALPYGLADGATGSAAYVMTLQSQSASDTSVWTILALVLVLLAAVAGAIVRQLRRNR